MASVLLILENLGEDKHVESVWLPRLDEGSTPSSSTINSDNQNVKQIAPNFTPENVRLGVVYFFVGLRSNWRKTRGKRREEILFSLLFFSPKT